MVRLKRFGLLPSLLISPTGRSVRRRGRSDQDEAPVAAAPNTEQGPGRGPAHSLPRSRTDIGCGNGALSAPLGFDTAPGPHPSGNWWGLKLGGRRSEASGAQCAQRAVACGEPRRRDPKTETRRRP